MRFLPILSALLLITGSGLATAGPDATGPPSAAPAPTATPSTGTPVPPPSVEVTPAIPPSIVRLPAPSEPLTQARTLATIEALFHQLQQIQQTLNDQEGLYRTTLRAHEAYDARSPSLETVLQAVMTLEKRLDALETAIHQLSVRNQAGAAVNRQIPQPSPTVTSSPTATADTVYVVQPGDTLNGLAARFAIERQRLIEFNRLETPDILTVGQRLRIPPEGSPRGVVMSPFREAQ